MGYGRYSHGYREMSELGNERLMIGSARDHNEVVQTIAIIRQLTMVVSQSKFI
jgi:hypothetical protein